MGSVDIDECPLYSRSSPLYIITVYIYIESFFLSLGGSLNFFIVSDVVLWRIRKRRMPDAMSN